MHYYVSHALSLPPLGIEPGSPGSQSGTLPKELSPDRQGGVKSPPHPNLPQSVEISITIQHNSMGPTQQYGPWILLIYISIKLPIDH